MIQRSAKPERDLSHRATAHARRMPGAYQRMRSAIIHQGAGRPPRCRTWISFVTSSAMQKVSLNPPRRCISSCLATKI